MNKLSKLLVVVAIMLAIVTISLNVNAYTKDDIVRYVWDAEYALSRTQYGFDAEPIVEYLSGREIEDAVADEIRAELGKVADILTEAGIVDEEGFHADKVNADKVAEILPLIQDSADKVGLTVTIDSATGKATVATKDGEVLTSIANVPVNASAAAEESSESSLLYTGANTLVFALPALAIVAVAIVAKKRA